MDGIHDLGGMDGFGPIDHSSSEPTFHEEWAGIVFATALTMMAQGLFTMDRFRHAIERLDPGWYLDLSYYEHWLAAMEKLVVETGTIDADSLSARARSVNDPTFSPAARTDEDLTEYIRAVIDTGGQTERDGEEPAFDIGAKVRVRNRRGVEHTRCPGYVQRARGTIETHHGSHVLPDANAHGEGERPEPLYGVRFSGPELWGDAAEAGTSVRADLWESYLEPA